MFQVNVFYGSKGGGPTSFSSASLSVSSLLERCLSGGSTLRLNGELLSTPNPPALNSTSLDRRRGSLAIPPRTNPMSDDGADVEPSSAWWPFPLPICPFSSSDSLECERRGGHSAIRALTPILGTDMRGAVAGSSRPEGRCPFGVW